MRWFKHMTGSSQDEFIENLEDEFGLEGNARYWKLLEAVAGQMGVDGKCSAKYSWAKWQTILKGKRKKLEYFLNYLEAGSCVKLIRHNSIPGSFRKQTGNKPETNRKQTGNESETNRKQNENILEIEIPNLLKYRDEYSRKSGQAPDKVPLNIRSKIESIETDTETDNTTTTTRKKYSDDDMKTSVFIFSKIQQLNPDQKQPNLDKWANTIRIMTERDNRSHLQIRELFTWANQDGFWQGNILSPDKLRKQWDTLTIKKNNRGNGNGQSGKLSAPEQVRQAIRERDQERDRRAEIEIEGEVLSRETH